jgi:hypothetical protein
MFATGRIGSVSRGCGIEINHLRTLHAGVGRLCPVFVLAAATRELSNACVMSVSIRQAGLDLRSVRINHDRARLKRGKCGFNTVTSRAHEQHECITAS